jgi:hypothetical protein
VHPAQEHALRLRAARPLTGPPDDHALDALLAAVGPADGERLRALPPAAFDGPGEPERTLTRLYVGLEDGRLYTRRELAARSGPSTWAVQEAVARSTARLLGRNAEDPSAPSGRGGGGAAPHVSKATGGAAVTGGRSEGSRPRDDASVRGADPRRCAPPLEGRPSAGGLRMT